MARRMARRSLYTEASVTGAPPFLARALRLPVVAMVASAKPWRLGARSRHDARVCVRCLCVRCLSQAMLSDAKKTPRSEPLPKPTLSIGSVLKGSAKAGGGALRPVAKPNAEERDVPAGMVALRVVRRGLKPNKLEADEVQVHVAAAAPPLTPARTRRCVHM